MEARQVFRSYETIPAGAEGSFRFCPDCGTSLPPGGAATQGRQTCPACGYVRYRNPLPGVVVLVVEGAKVLLCRRAPRSFTPGKWCLPGGFIEYAEDFLTAGIREVREETGLTVEIVSLLSTVTNFLAPGFHTLVVVLLARPVGGSPSPGDDAVDLDWVPLAGPLPDMAFEADDHIIRRYAATLLPGAPVDPRYSGARAPRSGA